MMALERVPGLGQRLADKLREHFDGEDAAMAALQSGDISRIASVNGVSPKRALALARAASGDDGGFLATREAEKLHAQLIEAMRQHAACAASRERLALLTPIQNPESRWTVVDAARALVASGAVADLADTWKGLARPRSPTGRHDRVVVTRQDRPELAKQCRVLTPGPDETWRDYRVFKQVSWIGEGAPLDAPEGWLVLPEDAVDAMALPEATLAWFRTNSTLLGLVADLVQRWPTLSAVKGAQPVLNRLAPMIADLADLEDLLHDVGDDGNPDLLHDVADRLWPTIKGLETQVRERVEEAMAEAQLALTGADMLDALANGAGLQRRLRAATMEAIESAIEEANAALSEFLNGTGLRMPQRLFKDGWPLKVDRKEVDLLVEDLERRIAADEAAELLRLSGALAPLRVVCGEAIEAMIELDQWLSVARWSEAHRCVRPTMVEHGLVVVEGRHPLLGIEPDPVTYGVGRSAEKGDQQTVALLTGANSGGKTTLLELLGFTCILAHMGLPVPAAEARVGRVKHLQVLAKAGGTQSAGALEQTLVDLAEVVSDPTSKLILADELEAITEPGAGARIIAGMLLAAEAHPDTSMVLVTHLAPAIIEATGRDDLRIDGIEARGLDEDLELIVDRTPRRNHLARSTPELIVRRLVERSEGPAKAVFASILEAF